MGWLRLSIQACLLTGLLLCIYLTVRRGLGAVYFRKGSPDAVETAMKWDPSNPQYYDALGTLMHLYADGEDPSMIVRLYKNAVRLSPEDAHLWADLGAAYDWAGRSSEAQDAFRHAHLLFPNSPEINWRLANFYFRTGQDSAGLHALQEVLTADSTAQRKVFLLATRAALDKKAILDEMLPPQAPLLFAYLDFEVQRGDIVGAEQVWARMSDSNLPFGLRDAFPYLDALLQHREVDQLAETWSRLAARFPRQIESPDAASNLITNGSFERDILNRGLDWRVVPTEGAVVSVSSGEAAEGTRALRIAFDGSRNLDYGHVFQYVLVQPSARYRFSGEMRVEGITTDSGPRFQICDAYNMHRLLASTANLVGTSGWSEQHAEFTTGSDTRLLLIRIARPASSKLDNDISGNVWIDRVRLQAEP